MLVCADTGQGAGVLHKRTSCDNSSYAWVCTCQVQQQQQVALRLMLMQQVCTCLAEYNGAAVRARALQHVLHAGGQLLWWLCVGTHTYLYSQA